MSSDGGLPMLATQNYTAILKPLQWLVIALIFLFFLRVIRAVWVEVRPAGPRLTRRERRAERRAQRADRPPKKRKRLLLEVVEPPEREGQIFDPDGELTVGRSPACGIPTTYDAYSSTVHARVFRQGDQLWVEDLGSTNGTFLNSERLAKPSKLGRGDLVQVGATVFEVTR
jgi:pSer/pThr/pTyr-binding forkhead associated (FHA) protein